MKNFVVVWLGMLLVCFSLVACGGGGGDSSAAQALVDSDTQTPPPGDGGTPPPTDPPPPGALGALTDLGDLLMPNGDHWYYTRAVAINDAGTIIGESNNNNWENVRDAFQWDPVSNAMTPRSPRDVLIDHANYFCSEAVDINNSGSIIGNSHHCLNWPDVLKTDKRAFIWANGAYTDLHPAGSLFSVVADINDNGEVVLTADSDSFYWDGVNFIRLPPMFGLTNEAVAINENGQVVTNSGTVVSFYDLNHLVIEQIKPLQGDLKAVAVDINDSIYTNNDNLPDGHVIGNSGNGSLEIGDDSSVRGFFWDGGSMYPVNDLGGGTSVTTDLNNSDWLVGAATLADGSFHAILWNLDANKKGVIRDLGTLGGANSFATAINESNQVTGWSETGQFYEEQGVKVPVRHAFLWSNFIMFDLGVHNDFYDYPFIPSFPFSEGVALNALGKVAGNSITINAHSRGFYLSPVFP